ncbi:hypothetical protein DICVIV_07055 [Dictyocaulus viviparus]|uniref:Uncharacterized protein n=1 Tax=Dictyocaulus viviparus TaxID=29172 RepID=A0A0D8XWY8_DICVI|nr:hypothetical protein DICVIV_07055 [Dictyocaulus viviparus]
MLIALIISQAVIHITNTFCTIQKCDINETTKLILYGFAYSLPFPLMVTISFTFRSHLFHILGKWAHSRSKQTADGSTLGKMTKHIRRAVAYSKLEMENSEMDSRNYDIQPSYSLRAILKEDAIYRVRFAMPQSVCVIEEEEENSSEALPNVINSCDDVVGQECEVTAAAARAFIESAQFLEQTIFIDKN